MTKPAIQIEDAHWEIVRDILTKYLPNSDVWAFGSRAKFTAKPFSDLDLAIINKAPLTLALSAELTEAFAESNLPWRVDIADWAGISPSFQAIIKQHKVVLLKSEPKSPC